MNTPDQSPLDQITTYTHRHDPGLSFPIECAPKRVGTGVSRGLSFHGVDIWNADELSWLDVRYTRRGGPDINPLHSSETEATPENLSGARQ